MRGRGKKKSYNKKGFSMQAITKSGEKDKKNSIRTQLKKL